MNLNKIPQLQQTTEGAKLILQHVLLHYQERLTNSIIAMELQVPSEHVVGMVNGLVKKGLLTRVEGVYQVDGHDVAVKYIIPTAEAFALVNMAWVHEEWMTGVSRPKDNRVVIPKVSDPFVKPHKLYKCKYCNSLYEKFHTNCPNCGAPMEER